MGRYEHGWATLEIMRTFTKNKRNYRKKIGRIPCSTEDLADDDGMQEDGDTEFTDSGDEGGANGAGKRKKVAQGGTSKKARI